MRYTYLLLSFLLLSYWCQAQNQLNTPLEILTFMQASPTEYEIEQLYGNPPPLSTPVIPHGTFININNGKEQTHEYLDFLSCKAIAHFEKAEAIMRVENPNRKKARKFYKKVLKEMPENTQVHTLIGQTYAQEGNYEEARKWFRKAIRYNPIDYLARWELAEIYVNEEKIDSAIEAITIAHIYNRNNPRLLHRLEEIYAKDSINNLSYNRKWMFDPKYRFYGEDGKIIIVADGIWLTYAMYIAVWEFEPDYIYIKQQQSVTDYLFHSEMEAIVGTYMTYSMLKPEERIRYPSMMALTDALDSTMVEEYVMYESLLVARPEIAYHLTDVFLARMVEYIQYVRRRDYELE